MLQEKTIQPIAYIKTDFPTKFGIPRQSGLVDELRASIIFTPEYRVWEAVRGLQDFSHIWLIWDFSQAKMQAWQPTVRPPALGGNTRVGVFATRSPFRPNGLGLSSVRLVSIEDSPNDGPLLQVAGADLLNGTPIYDIKPYLPYADSHPRATAGFTSGVTREPLQVSAPAQILAALPPAKQKALLNTLAQDPRPSYHNDDNRVYAMRFDNFDVKFTVNQNIVTVLEILHL